ncbi:unnamed protein product [Urochloa humidicola]
MDRLQAWNGSPALCEMDPRDAHVVEEEARARVRDQVDAGKGKELMSDEEVGEDQEEETGTEGAWVNQIRSIVLHSSAGQEDEEEEEFVFDEDEEPEFGRRRWMAVARYYSSRVPKSKIMFAELSNEWGEVDSRGLGENRYLLEFASENSLKIALRGGPWIFKGDAVIVVPYDGLARLSEITIESIPLWVRIYDIPVAMMMRPSFLQALGAKVGRVMEIGEAARDFKRIRVDFDLAEPLKPEVRLRVQGRGVMSFVVKYENVPYFCFSCGRIGHAERECPDEDLEVDGPRFGTELRTSPFKRRTGRTYSFRPQSPPARRGLNFSGAQRDRAASFSGSSTPRGAPGGGRGERPASTRAMGETCTKKGEEEAAVAAADLAAKVREMAVDGHEFHGSQEDMSASVEASGQGGGKVSGLDSYFGSSDGSLLTQMPEIATRPSQPLSMRERLQLGKNKSLGAPTRKNLIKSPRAIRDIEKQARNKKGAAADALAASLEVDGLGYMKNIEKEAAGMPPAPVAGAQAGEFQFAPEAANNLVGTQEEAHQEP